MYKNSLSHFVFKRLPVLPQYYYYYLHYQYYQGDPVDIRNIHVINNNFDYFNDAHVHVLIADNLEPEDHENNNVVPNMLNDIITISSECTDY